MFRTSKQARFKELFQSRARSEDEAASKHIPRNHLLVSSLVALLEERQNVFGRTSGGDGPLVTTTRDDTAVLRQLAEKYGMDVERLESLARSVNVPRVREGGVRYIKDAQSGEETAISEVGSPLLFFPVAPARCLMLHPGRVEGIGSPVGLLTCLHTLSSLTWKNIFVFCFTIIDYKFSLSRDTVIRGRRLLVSQGQAVRDARQT